MHGAVIPSSFYNDTINLGWNYNLNGNNQGVLLYMLGESMMNSVSKIITTKPMAYNYHQEAKLSAGYYLKAPVTSLWQNLYDVSEKLLLLQKINLLNFLDENISTRVPLLYVF